MRSSLAVASIVVVLAGCGGADEGEPLLGGELTAEYAGEAFTPVNGFATLHGDAALIALGAGPIHCGSESQNDPPSGKNAIAQIPVLEVGTYSSVFVQLFDTDGGFEGVGSDSGTITVTAVSADSVAGSVAYDYTADDGRHFAVSGSFDVVHCAP